MANRNDHIQDLSNLCLNLLQQLNRNSVPQWLELDLTFQQMKVLFILKDQPLKMSTLSERLKVSMPTITGIISRLVDRKQGEPLIERITSPQDRRQVWAHLTVAGMAITEQLSEINQNVLKTALTSLNDGAIEDARLGLHHILKALSDMQSTTAVSADFEPSPTNLNHAMLNNNAATLSTEPQPALS